MKQPANEFDMSGLESSPHRGGPFGPRPGLGTGAAAKAVAEDASALVRAELELAKAELAHAAGQKAAGAGLLAGAGVAGWLGLQGLLVTVALLLALVLPVWVAVGLVTVVLLAAAGALALLGKRMLATPMSLETTKANVEEDVAWTKAHLPGR
jgi:uncharacterized membrane protein YqjE